VNFTRKLSLEGRAPSPSRSRFGSTGKLRPVIGQLATADRAKCKRCAWVGAAGSGQLGPIAIRVVLVTVLCLEDGGWLRGRRRPIGKHSSDFGDAIHPSYLRRVIDDPVLRQAIEKQLDRIEHMHRFTRAVSVGNPREFLQAEKEDQEMAEACKRLIKNCIICWNYLYLSQTLEETEDAASREAFLDAVAHGSAISWQHINLLGEYDFSEEKLRDSVGIRPPRLAG
jgi:hypothetical protein